MNPLAKKPGKRFYVSPHRTGSKSGEMNTWDWIWVRIRYIGAGLWTLAICLAGRIEQFMPAMQKAWPWWLVFILAGIAAAIVRWDMTGLQRNGHNDPSPPVPPSPAPPLFPDSMPTQPPAPPVPPAAV